ncbi:MAG: helix-turn-helix transcriptional regulator [Suipraeoptans sp.]
MTNEKLLLFQELISCNYKIGLSSYDAQMQLLHSTHDTAPLYDGLLSASKNKKHVLSYLEKRTAPLVLSDSFGLVWIACFEVSDDSPYRIHILGPVYTSENSLAHIKTQIDTYDFSMKLKRMVSTKLEEIPVIISSLYFQYALMLHYCITGEKLKNSDLQYWSTDLEAKSSLPLDATQHHHGVWAAEQQLLSMVEHGNLNFQEILSDVALLSHGTKVSVGNPLRQAKISGQSFVTLCCRAAIRGGLSSETAYNLCDYYSQAVEETKTLSELPILNHTMYEDFIRRVHTLKQDKSISLSIQSCRDYIEMHVGDKLQIKELAELTGYSEYYLSRKFKKELGVSINTYIQNTKIEQAKLILSTTNNSIQDISDSLSFCSRSYFSDVFQKSMKMSPSDYREEFSRV